MQPAQIQIKAFSTDVLMLGSLDIDDPADQGQHSHAAEELQLSRPTTCLLKSDNTSYLELPSFQKLQH